MKKIKMSNRPYILKNTDFKTILVSVMFPFKIKKNDLAFINLLPNMLQYMNNKYSSEEAFLTAKKELYILSTRCGYQCIGEYGYFYFDMVIPDTFSLKDNLLDEQFRLFREMIYNPLIKDNGFLDFELNKEMNNLNIGMDNALKNFGSYQNIRVKEIMDDQEILSRDLIRHRELLNSVNTKNLYDYYKVTISDNQPVVFVMGNVLEDEINNLCDKYLFNKNFDEKVFEAELFYFLKPREKVLEITEGSKFKDSSLSVIYKVKDMCEDDIIYMNCVCDLLNSLSSRMLSKVLRDENNIVYSCGARNYSHYGAIEIIALVNKDNKELAYSKIIEVMDSFKDCTNFEDNLNKLKERKKLNLIRKPDNKWEIFNDYFNSSLDVTWTDEEYYEKFVNITASDISKFVDRLILDTVYFLKEEEHE